MNEKNDALFDEVRFHAVGLREAADQAIERIKTIKLEDSNGRDVQQEVANLYVDLVEHAFYHVMESKKPLQRLLDLYIPDEE